MFQEFEKFKQLIIDIVAKQSMQVRWNLKKKLLHYNPM